MKADMVTGPRSLETARPQPDRGVRFWDRIAAKYATQPIADMDTYREKLRLTQAVLRPDMRVLEIGCGTGSTALAHAPLVAAIDAADVSARMIEIARAKAAEAGCGTVTFRVAAEDEIAAPDGGYDAILALNLLHLLVDWPAAIARAHRALKPGGVYVTSTAVLADDMPWFGPLARLGAALGKIPRVAMIRETALKRALTEVGFEIETRLKPGPRRALFLIARKPLTLA